MSPSGWKRVTFDRPEAMQVLDELGSRGLVLDQDRLRAEGLVLLDDGALELGERQLLAEDVEEIEAPLFHAPGGADGIVGELGGRVGGVPALHDAVERRQLVRLVAAEPGGFDHAPAGGRGRLLVLGGEMIVADGRADGVQRLERLALARAKRRPPRGERRSIRSACGFRTARPVRRSRERTRAPSRAAS